MANSAVWCTDGSKKHGGSTLTPAQPVIYTVGFHWSWQTHNFKPLLPGEDWGFKTGAPRSETLWGTWIWLVLLSSLLASPGFLAKPPRFMILFEVHTLLSLAVFMASSIFYIFVHQKDFRNWLQTEIGMAVPTSMLLCLAIAVYRKRSRHKTRQNSDEEIGLPESSPLINESYSTDQSDTQPEMARKPRRPGWWEALWSSHGIAPYKQVRNMTGLISLGCVILIWGFLLGTAFSNLEAPRFCHITANATCP